TPPTHAPPAARLRYIRREIRQRKHTPTPQALTQRRIINRNGKTTPTRHDRPPPNVSCPGERKMTPGVTLGVAWKKRRHQSSSLRSDAISGGVGLARNDTPSSSAPKGAGRFAACVVVSGLSV